MTWEAKAAEAAKEFRHKHTPVDGELDYWAGKGFEAGALWEKSRGEKLVEALERVMEHTLAGVIRVEAGQSNGLDATVMDNIVRAALEEYRGKP